MERTIALFLLFIGLFASIPAKAEARRVQPVEVEMKLGVTMPVGSFYGAERQPSPSLELLEIRYNEKNTPWDFGLMLDFSVADWAHGPIYKEYTRPSQRNRTLALAFVSDYNFKQGHKVNPFAGIGVGVGINDWVGEEYRSTGGPTLVCTPRIGVELLYHIRLATQLNLSRKGYHNAAFTIGFVIGGRPKKQK